MVLTMARRFVPRLNPTLILPIIFVATISTVCSMEVHDQNELIVEVPSELEHIRAKRASKTTTVDTMTTEEKDDLWFGFFVIFGFILMIIQLYTTIFGRRMRNEGTRWHVLYVTIFMILNLLVYTDVDSDSPWVNYLHCPNVTTNGTAIQWITLTAFPSSIVFMIPLYLITYASPRLKASFFFKWLLWVIVYGAQIGIVAVLYLLYLKGFTDGTPPTDSYLQAYQFYINVAYYITIVYFLVAALLCGASFLCYSLTHAHEIEGELSRRFWDLIELFSFLFNILVVTVFIVGPNSLNSATYAMQQILPIIMEKAAAMAESAASSSSDGSGDTSASSSFDVMSLLQYADKFQSLIMFFQVSELYAAVIFFVANVIFIPMYRESLIQLLTCGACYRSDKNGSLWGLIPNRYRSIYPLEALRWANPTLLAQGYMPPPPPAGVNVNNSPLAYVNTNDKKELMVEQLE